MGYYSRLPRPLLETLDKIWRKTSMKSTEFNAQSGKSIMELMIVMTVIAILVTFAVGQLGSSKTNLHRQNLAREFKINLERARFDSVKRRATDPSTMANVKILN